MIKLLKTLVILVLLSGIIGGGAGAYYFLVEKPRLQDAQELAVAAARPAGEATPDPTTDEFEKVKALRRDQQYREAKAASEAFLTRYPESSHHDEAETMLGELNLLDLMSGQPGPDKVEYIVRRGDNLEPVARKLKTDPELIFQANNMERTILRIGQKLIVPQVDFAIDIHLKPHKLLLLNHGRFFKSYPILDLKEPTKKVPEIRTKVQEKIAIQDGKRVPFGSKEFPESLRSLTLAGQPGFTIYGEQNQGDKAGSGLGLVASDAQELHALVTAGTPVTISVN